MILGIDGGNSETKICGPYGVLKFPSDLGEYRELNLKNVPGIDDMVYEYQGRKGFAGNLARDESEFGGAIQGNTKAHNDTLIRILLALHRYAESGEYQIVVGQPIETHSEIEKAKIKLMLTGKHSIKINGREKTFAITKVEVAAEGGAGFWAAPRDGLVRILDIGSSTVNGATLHDRRYIDRDSFTLSYGAGTVRSFDLESMARGITAKAAKWGKQDKVLLIGGLAEEIERYISRHFPNAEVMRPLVRYGDGWKQVHPIYANAVGFYQIARGVYGNSEKASSL